LSKEFFISANAFVAVLLIALLYLIYVDTGDSAPSKAEVKQSTSQIASTAWLNNPNKVLVAKTGETLTQAGERLLGKRVDSLGIGLHKELNLYQSGPLFLAGRYDREGQPIYAVYENCPKANSWDGLLPLGDSFILGCGADSVARLEQLSLDPSSSIRGYCKVVDLDSTQSEVLAFADSSKGVFWSNPFGGDDMIIGLYREFIPIGGEDILQECDLKVRAASRK
jgi:hypothetical protein